VTDQLVLELLMRGAAVGAFVGLALVIARPPLSPARITGGLFCLAAAAHALTQQYPTLAPALSFIWPLVLAFSVMATGLFWAFAGELFGDRAKLEPVRFVPALALLLLGIVRASVDETTARALSLVHNLIGAGLLAHVLLIVWSGWRNDLVESRRSLRGPILVAAAVYAGAVITVESWAALGQETRFLAPLGAAVLLALGVAGVAALLTADRDLFASATAPSQIVPPLPLAVQASDQETRLTEKLDRLMRADRTYRQENLTIASLALKLGTPEYRLRRLINQRLGHRNFAAYLNQWRLAEAKLALGDPAQREVPISTIALDAGFQSLGPFNRAFKVETGLTPSEFRTQALAQSSAPPATTTA
jgi:AraC-like DNA-binding protein